MSPQRTECHTQRQGHHHCQWYCRRNTGFQIHAGVDVSVLLTGSLALFHGVTGNVEGLRQRAFKSRVGIATKALPDRNNTVHAERVRAPANFGCIARARGVTASINDCRVVENSIATETLRSKLHSGVLETGCLTCGLAVLNRVSCHENRGVQSTGVGVVGVASQAAPTDGRFYTAGSVVGLATSTAVSSVATAISN